MAVFDVTFESTGTFDTGMNFEFVETTDHNKLYNRFIDNQHSINAVQDLQDNLDNRIVKSYLTNLELDDIFNEGMRG